MRPPSLSENQRQSDRVELSFVGGESSSMQTVEGRLVNLFFPTALLMFSGCRHSKKEKFLHIVFVSICDFGRFTYTFLLALYERKSFATFKFSGSMFFCQYIQPCFLLPEVL